MKQRRRSTGLRQLLIAADDARRARWQQPRAWQTTSTPLPFDDAAVALRAGHPLIVSSAQVLSALMRAGLPTADFAYGGRYWNRPLLLDGDELTLAHDDEHQAE